MITEILFHDIEYSMRWDKQFRLDEIDTDYIEKMIIDWYIEWEFECYDTWADDIKEELYYCNWKIIFPEKNIVEELNNTLYWELQDSYEVLLSWNDWRKIEQLWISKKDIDKADDLYMEVLNTETTDEFEAGRISAIKYIIWLIKK